MTRRLVVFGFSALLLLFIGFPSLVGWAADWYWFKAIGFQSVFLKQIRAEWGLGVGVGVLAFAFLYYNLLFAQRGATLPIIVGVRGQPVRFDVTRIFRRLALPVSAILAFLFALSAANSWFIVQRFLYSTPFGATDPLFHREISYYVFKLPVVSGALTLISTLTFFSLLGTVPVYFMRGDVVVQRGRTIVEPSAQLHLGTLIALFFVTRALGIFLVRIPSLLYSTTGDRFVGASYADLHARLPMLRVLGVFAVLAAIAVIWGALRRRLAPYALSAVGGYILISIVGAVIPGLVQQFIVLPNELARETPQLRNHIAATRRAWNLDSVTLHDLNGEAELTLQDIRANRGTIENVRLWDRDPLLQTFGQLQEIRTYYDFVSVDDDRYQIDGHYRQVLLSVRDLNTNSLPTRNFINERLTFTHGMGLTLGPVNQVTPEGLPVLFIKDLPPASSVSINVKRPQVYYGEISSDYVFVGTGQPEFDFPSGDTNTYTHYTGSGGVPVQSWFRRLIFSVYFGSTNILFSKDITNESQVLFHRNIRERARTALPFIRWDADPYLVIRADGRMQWLLDGYTMSDRYPYAQPVNDGTNYMRNSVKLVIDAYDGSLEAYISAPDDPIIQTYARMFPGIFRPLETMAADLRAHIRYPEDLFRMQASLHTTYHMDQADVFFHREDQWQFPGSERTADPRAYMRHMIMKLPGEKSEEYIEMTPFTPRGKDNLAAWMVVRNDGANYGRLAVYRFPRQSLVFGPTQILNRINQNTEISQQLTLWDQRGSTVMRGNLLVIPIEGALIFVQALYLQADGGRIPELKRVIVAYKSQVVMEETLDQGLARIFGGATGATPSKQPEPAGAPVAAAAQILGTLAQQAAQHYDRAISAQRAGDWTTYGTEMRQVGELLQQMRQEGGKREE